ncbi:hypothetical protein [Streptomyces sp. NPDC059874]|uniref:hypothetical protein n=1 Tax=Streptomyces sp. NPDC059874 TaxID=3346983 RepID=UPI00364DD4AE
MALGLIAFASPAQAVDRNCYSGEFCVYVDSNFSTSNVMYRFPGADGDWCTGQNAICDGDSSWRNYWSVPATWYYWQGWVDVQGCLNPNYQLSYDYWLNDEGRSHKWKGGSTC